MELRSLDRTSLNSENNLKAQRLLPWPALNAPFEGSWCVIAPGTASTLHGHHEYEIFIAINGEAVLETDGVRVPFKTGDIVAVQAQRAPLGHQRRRAQLRDVLRVVGPRDERAVHRPPRERRVGWRPPRAGDRS